MRLLFVNQYGPPDPSPTARLMGELAGFLQQSGHEVKVICQTQNYYGRPARGWQRLWREGRALVSMAWAGLRAGRPAPEIVLTLSSPPGVLVLGALLARWHRARLVHWAMDLYPELAVVLGEVPAGSSVAGVMRRLMGWAYRHCALLVALDDDMAAHLRRTYRVDPRVLPPWPAAAIFVGPPAGAGPSPGQRLATERWTWLYSGNLGRAHEWQPLLDVQAELERRELPVQLVFEGGGPSWQPARQYAEKLGLRQCQWTGYVSEAQSFQSLQASRLIVATQRREAMGLLWPSKLARIIPLDKPLLWIGPMDGAVARSLGRRANTACFEPDGIDEIVRWIEKLHRQEPSFPAVPGDEAATNRIYEEQIRASCQRWEEWLSATRSP